METAIKWILTRFTEGWAGVQVVAAWADENVLAAIFFGYVLREVLRYIVKKTPTKYDDIGFEIIEDAVAGALSKVSEAKARLLNGGKK